MKLSQADLQKKAERKIASLPVQSVLLHGSAAARQLLILGFFEWFNRFEIVMNDCFSKLHFDSALEYLILPWLSRQVCTQQSSFTWSSPRRNSTQEEMLKLKNGRELQISASCSCSNSWLERRLLGRRGLETRCLRKCHCKSVST